jgi:hypothetical protein
LIDVEALKCSYDAEQSGLKVLRSGSGRGAVGPRSGGGRDEKSAAIPSADSVYASSSAEDRSKPRISGGNGAHASYLHADAAESRTASAAS